MKEPEFILTSSEELDIPPIDMYSVSVGRANKYGLYLDYCLECQRMIKR